MPFDTKLSKFRVRIFRTISPHQYCEIRKFKTYKEYGDHGSGRKGDRTEYLELMDAVRKRKLDVVMVWKFDLIAHSTKMMVNALDGFRGYENSTTYPAY